MNRPTDAATRACATAALVAAGPMLALILLFGRLGTEDNPKTLVSQHALPAPPDHPVAVVPDGSARSETDPSMEVLRSHVQHPQLESGMYLIIQPAAQSGITPPDGYAQNESVLQNAAYDGMRGQ